MSTTLLSPPLLEGGASSSAVRGPQHVRNRMEPMEVEISSTPTPRNGGQGRNYHRHHPIDQLWQLIKLHIEYYPKLSTAAAAIAATLVLFFLARNFFRSPITRNRLEHDYTEINMQYNFKASQIDHWCLFGGDDACRCDDFSEPISREERPGWIQAHQANVKRIVKWDYDVVFVGADTVEGWNGVRMNHPMTPDGPRVKRYFESTFSKEDGGQFDGLALGIAGDSSANLLWRLKHGEMPTSLNPLVWWLSIGSNDLSRGGCSEEATVLGILHVAEVIAFAYPQAAVVIQGILPRTNRPDGSLEDSPASTSVWNLFSTAGRHHYRNKIHSVQEAKKEFLLWPSIEAINQELFNFCAKHDNIIFFDPAELFVGHVGNEHYKSEQKQIVKQLMPDYVHLSYEGYEVLGKAVEHELEKIVFYDDFSNDIEN